jgi:hypothetical protein
VSLFLKRTGTILFYIGGLVWIIYALLKYLFGCDVNIRQFLPFHLMAVIPAMFLKYGCSYYEKCAARAKQDQLK